MDSRRRLEAKGAGRKGLSTCVLALALAVSQRAAAAPPERAAAPEPSAPSASEAPGRFGYWILIGSLAAGSALTAFGLSIGCDEADIDCQRGASVAIWGGVGVASVGSIAGIAIVQSGQREARRRAAPRSALRLELAPLEPLSHGSEVQRGLALRLVY